MKRNNTQGVIMNKIGFIGLGLIGGSIAKKIRQNCPHTTIIATAGRQATITEAYAQGIIDNNQLLALSEFSDCDYIFLCAPVQRNLEYLAELKPIIRKDCYITDVGSTKTDIHREVIRLGLERNFIGGHPMTGSEKTGIVNANPAILVNAYYIITPTAQTPPEDVELFANFVRSLGSIPLILDYETHDHATAAISHLPHMIAYSLVNLVQDQDDEHETMKTIAAGGFKDLTRIASSSPVMWQNICLSNREQLLKLMDDYMDKFLEIRHFIAESDCKGMLSFFQSAKDYRDSISVPSASNDCLSIHEFYLDLEDRAGELARVTDLLAESSISIKDLSIVNNREFEDGVLRIEFYHAEPMEAAAKLLEKHGYQVYYR